MLIGFDRACLYLIGFDLIYLVNFISVLNSILLGTACELFLKGYKNLLNLIFNKKEYSYSIIKKERLERIHQNEGS